MWWLTLAISLLSMAQEPPDPLLKAMTAEIQRQASLKNDTPPVYYLAYRVEESEAFSCGATLGEPTGAGRAKARHVDVIVRVGTPDLDNTHEMKGPWEFEEYDFGNPELLPTEEDEGVVRRELWRITQKKLGKAVERYQKVAADENVKAKAEDTSGDYTLTAPVRDLRPKPALKVDASAWKARVAKVSEVFRAYPGILRSTVHFSAQIKSDYFADSSGTVLRHPSTYVRLFVTASARSDDGMDLYLHNSYSGFSESELPDEKILLADSKLLAEKLMKLRVAPTVEPYIGPAILLNKAAAVFFHEVLGHRMEGHRQKSEKEGQTFTKKVGEEILPGFISIVDDPSQSYFQKKPLMGHYPYDDEGVAGSRALLVEKGVLKGFLMGRSPIKGFGQSNGHGRSNIGLSPVARQGNLIVGSDQGLPNAKLRESLIEEVKKQGKPYGLIFADISGGFTETQRYGPQAFKVIPLEVYRVYADGRPDEIVRGVDIVGTPLIYLKKILAAGDDPDIFNGWCGAESGSIPVSAVAPSILLGEIEVEKKLKEMEKPPILPSPLAGGGK